MIDTYLPITSYFFKKDSKKSASNLFHFNLYLNNEFNYICLKNFKENPSLEYKHKWLTCFEPEKHLDELSVYLKENYILEDKKNIFGISFKDDSLIKRIKKITKNVNNIKSSRELGLPVTGACLYKLFEFCNYENIGRIIQNQGKADILLVRHILEHSWNIRIFIETLKLFLKKDGIVIFEVPDSERGLKTGMQTLLWEEHASYFTKDSLFNFLLLNGFEIKKFFRHPNQIEDSLVVIAKKNKSNTDLKNCSNYDCDELLNEYVSKFNINKNKIKSKINKIISNGSEVYIFGAGHHASSFVSINNLNNKISFVIDDNSEKHAYCLPGSNIPIVSSLFLKDSKKKIHLFLTTNPEQNNKIKDRIYSINKFITIDSIFDFY